MGHLVTARDEAIARMQVAERTWQTKRLAHYLEVTP